jgi:hypothetical protein
MNRGPLTISGQPVLQPPEDYYRLRREGIGLIEQMAGRTWTDYNTHDPGITIHEGLCYILTELAYRTGLGIRDILMPATPSGDADQPFPGQAFFSAKSILTVNPVTSDDFRRLLIGLDRVRNAWLFCKTCACDALYYAWCEDGQLQRSFAKPQDKRLHAQRIDVLGLYDVLLELEADPESGDLNARKIELAARLADAGGKSTDLTLELRFPQWELTRPEDWQVFLGSAGDLRPRLRSLGASRDYDLLGDAALDDAGRDAYMRSHWNDTLYLGIEVEPSPLGPAIAINHITLHLFGGIDARNRASLSGLRQLLEDDAATGMAHRYRLKAQKMAAALANAARALAAHRNLDEDFCSIRGVDIEDIAVCADIEVAADADIEWVQAQAWFEIEQYFTPAVPHHTLQEMMDAGVPVEDIFNGPASDSGFIRSEDLAASELKRVLRTSDIVNRLMDIAGVVAVRSLLLSGYDIDGKVIKGAADPVLNAGKLIFDPARVSARWQLLVSDLHQPRLYYLRSRFLFLKNGLPFLARGDEAGDLLLQLRGEAERPKRDSGATDLPVPGGVFLDLQQYCPLQYTFPLAYGIGPEGLPSSASARRRAQAKQLQAYLMVFEQLLANAYAQLAHTADLFSLDAGVSRTYFPGKLDAAVIRSYDQVVDAPQASVLDRMTESTSEFQDRRNRFLDHLMARFGESFHDHTLLLTRLNGRQSAGARLIGDKISFLAAYPAVSSARGKAFNYTRAPLSPDNKPGLKKRIGLLLGAPDLHFAWTPQAPVRYVLKDASGNAWMQGAIAVPAGPQPQPQASLVQQAHELIVARMTQADAYHVVPDGRAFALTLKGSDGVLIGTSSDRFPTAAAAGEMLDELLAWSAIERAILVEHLLLRPKFPGDALFPPCPQAGCDGCSDADPYSFRLGLVMPGWVRPFDANLELRAFADRTIRQETPSHLLARICWVGNDGFIDNHCDPVVAHLADLLQARGLTAGGARLDAGKSCLCAQAIHAAFSAVFKAWYADRTLDELKVGALQAALEDLFADAPDPASISCAAVLDAALFAQARALMTAHFHAVAAGGWQFERFEHAWRRWLEANAAIDWPSERLQERVEALLKAGMRTESAGEHRRALCECAAGILAAWGGAFHDWMEAQIAAGRRLDAFSPFPPPEVASCAGVDFQEGTTQAIGALLARRYAAYTPVSYYLRLVVSRLAGLSNTYPGATLHDCNEGGERGDIAPVRLGHTALGNYPRRRADGAAAMPGGPAPESRAAGEAGPAAPGGRRLRPGKRSKPRHS